MRAGMILLGLGYVLSQFFRAFLAVLSPLLLRDLGTGPDHLAQASGFWFLSFAVMQLPVGLSLDRIGPRRTAAFLLLIGAGGGALLFSLATVPWHVSAAMLLIGAGCSPALMASYYIFAREFPPARFGVLAALMIGIGSLGNLVASYPTALAADWFGWRATMAGLAAITALVAVGILVTVRDPAKLDGDHKGSVLSLLAMPAFWAILPLMLVSYAPAAALRGLWIGPYMSDIFGSSTAQIGLATFVMGVAMIVGTLIYGPLDRIFGSRKWVIFAGNLGTLVTLALLMVWVDANVVLSVALISLIGLFGASYPLMIAHGRAFVPPHLLGRGVSLLNLFSIGGVGVIQFGTGRIHGQFAQGALDAPYIAIFGFFALLLVIGLAVYAFSRDTLD